VHGRFPIGSLTAAVAAVALVAALVVSCGSAGDVAAPTTSVTGAEPTLPVDPGAEVAGATEVRPVVDPDLEQRLRATVLSVSTEGCGFVRQGTVSIVDLAGSPLAVTNRHVVAGSTDAAVTLADGTTTRIPIGGAVVDRDAAVLDPESASVAGLTDTPLVAGPTPSVGDEVVVAGHPDGRFTAQSGRVTAVEDRVDDGGTVRVIVVDVPTTEGASGGVVVDAAGRAVGLVAARDPDTNSAVAYPFSALTGGLESTPPSC